jgi:hypothetical protein
MRHKEFFRSPFITKDDNVSLGTGDTVVVLRNSFHGLKKLEGLQCTIIRTGVLQNSYEIKTPFGDEYLVSKPLIRLVKKYSAAFEAVKTKKLKLMDLLGYDFYTEIGTMVADIEPAAEVVAQAIETLYKKHVENGNIKS